MVQVVESTNPQFKATFWAKQNIFYAVVMELPLDFTLKEINVKIVKKNTNNVVMSKKCNQRD